MANDNYAKAKTLVETAELLLGKTGFQKLQGDLGYTLATTAPQRQRVASQANNPIIIRPRGSGVEQTWNTDLTPSARQKDHDVDALASTVDYFVAMKHVAKAREGNGALARLNRAFKSDFQNNWMMTGTHATYNPQGQQDSLTHNWRSPRESRLEVNLAGPDGWLNELADAPQLTKAYFGTEDVRDVVAVINAVSGKNPYMWRLKKPLTSVERPVVLGLYDVNDGFGIDAYVVANYGSSNGPARGVALRKKI